MAEQLGLGICPGRHRRRRFRQTARRALLRQLPQHYVDNRPEKRYRELEAFPGFEIDQIAARKFGKLTGEVNLPPVRFEEVGTAAFFLSYARPALFGGTMLLDSPEDRKYTLFTLGAQVDLGFTVVMRLPMVLSFGVAQGFGDKDIDGRTEFMASLKIL